jgi:glycosyltransferase involved in cell wall biosynthesis
MERLSERGHEVRVIDFEIGWRTRRCRGIVSPGRVFVGEHKATEGGKVTVIRPPFIRLPVLDYASILVSHDREIRRQLRAFRPDVIVGFGILNAMLASRVAKDKRIPFVYYLIDELHRLVPQKVLQPLAKSIESMNLRNADRVLVINEGLRDYAVSMGAGEEKILVLKAGVDVKRFGAVAGAEAVRKKYGFKGGDKVLFFMGFLYSFSGLKEVAVELSRRGDESIKLLVVGDGDAFEDLKRIRAEYGLWDQVVLTGKQPYDSIPDFISAADVCLLPAYDNGIMRNIVPIKLYEYLALGKPVVATRLPGVMKEFGEDSGVVYVDAPEDAVAKAVELLGNGGVQDHGLKARRFVEKYDWNKITVEFERILEELI